MTGRWSRRNVLRGAAYASALGLPNLVGAALKSTRPARKPRSRIKVHPFPLGAVRLRPSPYLTAVESNGRYLLRLEPDRLLHNFRVSAGLAPKGFVYGGWESESLAGHTLGHYLSACSLMFAQTGDPRFRDRVNYIVAELVLCQDGHGDGYVGGFTRNDGTIEEDGKVIFAEIARGDIRSRPFSLNGAWSPLYRLHKLFAGLLDSSALCANPAALQVALGLASYLEGIFSSASDEQIQEILVCEYGGLNESFAQLHERTNDGRWLGVARRLYDHKVLDPLTQQSDELDTLHSNTQIPKLIGLARLHEITGESDYATAARFFWETVTANRSYVIGGNADRETFESPLSRYVTEQTCESCNTYNMLKLTRHLYQWKPDAAYFDFYERAHLNHILAQHDPDSGMFAYMMPMMSGAKRELSKPFDDFWCCVGTGMESHSKHGDSIYWRHGEELFVNLYIPSELAWKDQGAALTLRTDHPFAGEVALEIAKIDRPRSFAVSFRVPGWCDGAEVEVNGKSFAAGRRDGYLQVRREWSAGDRVDLRLKLRLRSEGIVDDANLIALLYGPMVMAADLGPAEDPFAGQAKSAAERSRRALTDSNSRDLIRFGEAASEQAHELHEGGSSKVLYRGRSGLQARSGSAFGFRLRSGGAREQLVLQVTYWGRQRNSRFRVLVNGTQAAWESMDGTGPIDFVERDYALPIQMTHGKRFLTIRFEPEEGAEAGPVFGCRLLPKSGVRNR